MLASGVTELRRNTRVFLAGAGDGWRESALTAQEISVLSVRSGPSVKLLKHTTGQQKKYLASLLI